MRKFSTTITTKTTSSTTLAPMATITYSQITNTTTHYSPWLSPIPYLFGGLAAMLVLIAIALLMLAFSYWRLSSQAQSHENGSGSNNIGDDDDDDDDDKEGENEKDEPFKVFEEKILVIMAGEQKPTFLATPVCNVYGKHHLGKDFCEMEIGKSDESFNNVSEEKETLDKDNNNHVVVHFATQENNEDSHQESHQEQLHHQQHHQ